MYERKQRQKINNFYIKHVLTPNIFFAVKIQRYCFRGLEKIQSGTNTQAQ